MRVKIQNMIVERYIVGSFKTHTTPEMNSILRMMSNLVDQLGSMEDIPYEDASKFYKCINYFSFCETTTRESMLKLVRDHPLYSTWNTEMYSWLLDLARNPLITEEDLEVLKHKGVSESSEESKSTEEESKGESSEEKKPKHILYYYPDLMPMFRARYHLGGTEESGYTEDLKRDFPQIFEEYSPTLAEKALLHTGSLKGYKSLCKTENPERAKLYLSQQLLLFKLDAPLSEFNIEMILQSLLMVKNSGISEERFSYYVDKNWKNEILDKVILEFLHNKWSRDTYEVIAQILSFSSEVPEHD